MKGLWGDNAYLSQSTLLLTTYQSDTTPDFQKVWYLDWSVAMNNNCTSRQFIAESHYQCYNGVIINSQTGGKDYYLARTTTFFNDRDANGNALKSIPRIARLVEHHTSHFGTSILSKLELSGRPIGLGRNSNRV